MERLLHYSANPLIKVRSSKQGCREFRNDKPCGLWVSVEGGDDWASWCHGEGFRVETLKLVHEIVLASDANILRLSNATNLDTFTSEYFAPDPHGGPSHFANGIRWADVAERYQGIIIAPYVWERRMTNHTFWYYGWDCASGCIWDASAIKSVIRKEA